MASLWFNNNTGWHDGRGVFVDGNFYANGVVVVKIVTHSKNAIWGCRGGVLLVGLDAAGNVIWSHSFQGMT